LTSLARWDSENGAFLSRFPCRSTAIPACACAFTPMRATKIGTWSETFLGAGAPLTDLKVRRMAAGVEVHSIVNRHWSWSTGAEIANRNFRKSQRSHFACERARFFSGATSVVGRLGVVRTLLRVPERRFTVDSSAEARPAASLLTLSGRSPGSADRFARIGFRARRVTT